jgi:hypothetical protein
LWTGWPRAANALRDGWEKMDRGSLREGRPLKPFDLEKALRSRTWSPIAMAGRFSDGLFLEVMIPKGMLEREKWLFWGIDSHDLRGAILVMVERGLMVMLTWMCTGVQIEVVSCDSFGMELEKILSLEE